MIPDELFPAQIRIRQDVARLALCLCCATTPTDSINFNPESHLSRFRPGVVGCKDFISKVRVICAIGVAAVDIGLAALDLHFLSDVVAGSSYWFRQDCSPSLCGARPNSQSRR
jgi:hypothetical protein